MKKHISLSSPHMSEEGYEREYVKKAFELNMIAALGENVTEFENGIVEITGAKKAVALSSGTSAMHMALKAVGVGKEDIVFCQSLTFSATANPIIYEGAIPVFIDCDIDSWNMNPDALELAFEKYEKIGKKPKAVIVVHLYGMCAHIEDIVKICQRYQVPLIEDAAESLGTTYHGKHTGSFGEYGIISFNGNKIITSSGGGMLLINTEEAKEKAAKVRYWSTQAREPVRWYQHTEIGYNYRMSNIAAGIGRGQLKVLGRRIEKKRYIYAYYQEGLKNLPGINFMPMMKGTRSNCWLTCILLDVECKVKPLDIIKALEKEGVESRPIWKPLHLQPVFAGYDFISQVEKLQVINRETRADNSVSGVLFNNGICLPSDTKLSDIDLDYICCVVKKLWK
ncbi:aminotransferase class I/II-fold pyridoxal phosphate-dependent enzyme [Petralouisia muris]|jgi:dTDP-4-amino-4,6-dideoxygalactose transaminase|uniref:Aminotransferase class I/II-fold pyridoxal phosphate-dependent enzyme n=1 Tax=Petralouisia muris TaxID=3032872 RepID=A0AC61RPE6_9FIRM|nr:aminotransferase class I/II-fold pyridoxal phosphate-dependent enzyme [Petralouisia muris]TGY90913.1 aminotransferase class I/II-fold pyridoxal phosphate-dependent enzyme [Petralouisia muris]